MGKSTKRKSALQPRPDSESDWFEEFQKEQEVQTKPKKSSGKRSQDISGESSANRPRVSTKRKGAGGSQAKKEPVLPVTRKTTETKAKEPEEIISSASSSDVEVIEPRQCYWFSCCKEARFGSKYCSDDCGIKLAKLRIQQILPQRLWETQETPWIAQEKSQEELNNVCAEEDALKETIKKLDTERNEWIEFFEKLSSIPPLKSIDGTQGKMTTDEGTVWCVICGHSVGMKGFMKHVEKCYDRLEKSLTLDSTMPATGEVAKTIICDELNKDSKRYCKRVGVLCPEHKKKKLPIPHRKICGAPLTEQPDISQICKASQNECTSHYGWDRGRIALIDCQKLSLLYKSEGLLLRRQKIRTEMESRGGLLALLLHSTVKADDWMSCSGKLSFTMPYADILKQ